MTYKLRYILLIGVNAALMVAFFYLSRVYGWNVESRRLVQINPSDPQDAGLLVAFVGLLLVGFLANFLLLHSGQQMFSRSKR